MELDPAEMMDSVFSRISDDKSPLLKELLNEGKYKKIGKKLESKLGMPADKITRKKLIDARRSSIYKKKKPDDMKTAVDLYLYDLAQRMNKHVGGIEDVSDQMDIFDEMGGNVDIDQLIKDIDDEEGLEKYKERMITVYVKEDIDAIDKMVSDEASELMSLIKRNIKMARRMDSLTGIRNTFFAVGAAHLPGDSGVISLLRQRGFTVEPVTSANKITPEKYNAPERKVKWQLITGFDSAYTVEMPGKASDMDMFGDELKFKAYVDMSGGNKLFMSCAVFIPEGDSAAVNERMQRSFGGKGFEKIHEKTIMHSGMAGKEVTSHKDNLYYRMQFFAVKDKVYMLFFAAPVKEQLYGEVPEHFFQSLKPNLAVEATVKNWAAYPDSIKAFSIMFPGKVIVKDITPQEKKGNAQIFSYAALDMPNNTYYMLVVSETKSGYYITDDSLIFNTQIESYTAKGFAISDKRYFEMNSFPALSLLATGEQEGTKLAFKVLIVSRGNRSYTVAAITEKGKEDYPNITRFFRSFSLLPNNTSVKWSMQQPAGKAFSVWSPSVLDVIETGEDTQPSKEIQYVGFDKSSVDNYYINAEPVSKYYYTDNDSSFLADDVARYYTDTASYVAKNNPGNFDSLVSIKNVKNGKTNGLEILVKNASKSFYKRVRVLRNADSVYALFVMAPYAILYNDNSNRFFENFSFTNEAAPTTVFTNKTNLLLNDLLSADSAVKEGAKEALNDCKVSGKDIDLLYEAFLQTYPADTNEYYSIHDRIADKIEGMDTISTIQFVKENYTAQPPVAETKMLMLRMLASLKKADSYTLLKQLLLEKPYPTSFPGKLVATISDSLLLAKQLFPGCETKFADTILGPGFISITVKLVDSGLLEKQILIDNKSAILGVAKRQLEQLKNNSENYFSWGFDVIKALQIIGGADAVKLLNQMVKVKDLETKKDAVAALATLNEPLPPTELQKLAQDKYYRIELYELLKKQNKTNLYPKEFLSQAKFGEAYTVMLASEEDLDTDNISCILIGEKTALYKGVQSRFYIYKLVVRYDVEKYEYPAVSGPFDMNKSNVQIKPGEDWTRIFYEEKVPTTAAVNNFFGLFLKDLPSVADTK